MNASTFEGDMSARKRDIRRLADASAPERRRWLARAAFFHQEDLRLYRLRHGPAGPPRKKFHRAGILSDGSETPELSLRPLFEEYHAQVGG